MPRPQTVLRAVAISAASALALIIVFQVSFADAFKNVYPYQTLSLAPRNAIANANMAARLQAAGRLREARILALAALTRDPSSIVALRTFGLAADADGHSAEALRMMDLAHALSRRDLPTQLWLITHAIRNGDFEAAVHHFDLAMRTSSWGKDQLIPLLVAASEDERVLPPLSRLLARNPSWKLAFLGQLAAFGPRPDHTVQLTRGRLNPAIADERDAIMGLINRLASARQFDLAWTLYRDASPGADPATLRHGNFEGSETYPPFDWALADEPDLSALRISRPDGVPGNALALTAQNNRSGEVARQVFHLVPGAYRLELEVGAVPAASGERPLFSISCPDQAGTILAFRPNVTGQAPQRVGGGFTVPTGCAWQSLSISISASGSDETTTPWIDNLMIRRAG
jgi:tetratricopeptide (TPR) repeat protein